MNIDLNQLDAETQALILPLLPETAKEMVACIGLPATLTMVTEFGGSEIRFARASYRGAVPDSFRQVADVVGDEAAEQLRKHFGGQEFFYIPRCFAALRTLRDRQIIDSYYAALIAHNSARVAANEVGRRFKLSYRGVEKIVNGGYEKYRKGKK